MKKFLVILLSLGLIVAFGASASATDVKFSGTYYVVGVYDNNQKLADSDVAYSRAFFYQRIRIQPVFQVAEGLTFTARMDAMEKQWGQTDWRGGTDDKNSSRRQTIAYNPKIQESFEWERGYVGFKTAAGMVQAGIMASGAWGTEYGDDTQSRPRIRFDSAAGPMKFGVVYEKEFEADTSSQLYDTATGKLTDTASATTAAYKGKVDADRDTLSLYGIYGWKGGQAGVLYKFYDRADTRLSVTGQPYGNYRSKFHALLPYFKATFGPVYMEGELVYMFGKAAEYDSGGTDKDMDGLGAYLKVQTNLGPAYFGALVFYTQGDDKSDKTKTKTGPGSQDLNPALILGNDELQTWEASNGNGNVVLNATNPGYDSGKGNSTFYGAFGGFKPTKQLAIEVGLYAAQIDKIPTGTFLNANTSKSLGYEFDVSATYKIYDNLSYMVGAGYLWTGDAFKGFGTNSADSKIGNDYLLMNKLSLSF